MKFDTNFYDAHDLIECLNRGCEIEFMYNGRKYSITHTKSGISITEFYNENSEKNYAAAEQLLEHTIGKKAIKDIISEMKIIDRSF